MLSLEGFLWKPYLYYAKGLVAELTPLHVQSAWGFRGEMVRAAGLAACCNSFSKKKKKKSLLCSQIDIVVWSDLNQVVIFILNKKVVIFILFWCLNILSLTNSILDFLEVEVDANCYFHNASMSCITVWWCAYFGTDTFPFRYMHSFISDWKGLWHKFNFLGISIVF